MTVLLVIVGAAIGAPLRYLTDRMIQARHPSTFPWGTLSVNICGSALLGLVVGLPVTPGPTFLIGVGFCGAFTTYSTFSYETLRLAQCGARLYALLNVAASIILGLIATYAGFVVGSTLSS